MFGSRASPPRRQQGFPHTPTPICAKNACCGGSFRCRGSGRIIEEKHGREDRDLERQFGQGAACQLLAWLDEAKPDVVCLQEIKCLEADFPALEIKGLGYHIETLGQRSYNGVALLSKEPARDVMRGLPGDDERRAGALSRGDHRRTCASPRSICPTAIRSAPTNTTTSSPGCGGSARACARCSTASCRACWPATTTSPDRRRCVRPARRARGRAVPAGIARAQFRVLLNLGLVDAFRVFHPEPHRYSFWDYYGRKWLTRRRAADRSSAAVAAGGRPASGLRHRPRAARARQAVRPHAGLVRADRPLELQAVAQPQIVELAALAEGSGVVA